MLRIKHHQLQGLLILAAIWLVGAVSDRIWFAFDNSTPAWDQADYLTGGLNYWQALQQPQWFSGEWWTNFWQLSSKIPPLIYILAGVAQHLFGRGIEQATLVNVFFSAILLASVYGLGILLFDIEVGLWAAALCQLFPSLYRYRLDFLLDYPLAAAVTLSFFCLTLWRMRVTQSFNAWLCAAAFGISFGLALLVKQTALFFLLTPILWLALRTLYHRQWRQLAQLMGGLLLSILVFAPWYRINWLIVITSGKRATIDSAIAEGDPPLNTLAAWTYYWEILPFQVSWILLLVPIVGLIVYWRRHQHPYASLVWLGVFLVGAYFLGSLNINKDERYILPYLPVIALFLAYGLTCWRGRWGSYVRWGSVGLALLLMLLNIFPVGSWGTSIARTFSPKAERYAFLGTQLPHSELIATVIHKAPYLRSTLGVLPSTAAINQHNVNYYGALRDFQVYGRQVGTKLPQVAQDVRSLDWFVTKTGDQGSVPAAQAAMLQTVERSPHFQIVKSWLLSDRTTLNLYHHKLPSVEVKQIQDVSTLALSRVTVPQQAPPGIPIPVTYEWVGSREQLQSGLVLLDWRSRTDSTLWIHDHAIALGNLVGSTNDTLQVVERMAMLPPATTPAGNYTLSATYLNRQTGETYPIAIPAVTLQIAPSALPTAAPELDLLTQLRTLAATLPQGTAGLEHIFAEVARINQYDPTQDYLSQTQQTLKYRLQQQPQLNWAYTLALSTVLQQQVEPAIAALETVTQLDAQNPYAYAYLAFVHLYNWQGFAAEASLKTARTLNPNIPEFQALSGIAALMRGNALDAWQYLKRWQSDQVRVG